MKKIHILGLALVALFAFSAIAAASAFAEPPVWLVSGEPVLTLTSVETRGLVFLTNLKVPVLGTVKIDCEGILDGSVGPEGEDEITEVLNLSGVKIGELGGTALLCNNEAKQCEKPTEVELFVEKLPWLTLLVLVGANLIDLGETPAYEVVCKVLGTANVDLCESATEGLVENMPLEVPPDVLVIFKEENRLLCTLSGEKSGDVEGEGLVSALEGLSLGIND